MPTKEPKISEDRCKHEFKLTRDNLGICSRCKEERQYADDGQTYKVLRPGIPPRSATRDNQLIHKYYEACKEQILRDVKDLGQPAMLKRWEILSGTFAGLKKRWVIEDAKKAVTAGAANELDTSVASGTRATPVQISPHVVVELPPLPEFDVDWPLVLQLMWLDTYKLVLKKKLAANGQD